LHSFSHHLDIPMVGIISTSLSGKWAGLAFLIQAKANVIAQDYYY
jgi:hypothetical protein